jgi:hypothetical protein
MCLKLIKAGDIVKSNQLKHYFLTSAKEVQLIDYKKEDDKKL